MKSNSLLKGNAIFEKYIRKNFIKYVVILLIYFVGFLIGIGIFNSNIKKEEAANEISIYVIEKLESLAIKKTEAISNYIKQDFGELIIISVLSFSIIGVPVIVIMLFIKSLSLGITISSLISALGVGNGVSFSILIFMIPVIIKMFILLIIVCSSLKFIENICKYKKELRYEIIRHALVNLITFFAICFVTMYRYVSLNIVSQIFFSNNI